ncbi:sirohydrochlorin chelatase [Streptomyces natalensis]|uniref:sirohydrochlorin chelatase n=1 Tax=Streptomyces natalensis TaxID=68242 RepID=UPI00099B2DC1|nr:sirohydrochlorin chelatase [Streptomyces natalensis]
MTTPPALLIAGHGTRDEGGAEALRTLVRVLAARHPDVPVAGGFFGAADSPLPLGDAVDELAGRGVTRLVAVPLLLAPTGRAGETLDAALARAAGRHPGLDHACGAELGPHPRLLEVLERRLDEALGGGVRRPEDRARTTVLLVGHGASDPYANAEVVRAARLLWEGRGFAGVETAFLTQAAPDVPAGLDRCRALAAAAPAAGGPGRIVVLPYFFFPGGLLERLRMQTEGWAAVHPHTEVLGAGVLGTPPEVAEVVMERYRETVAGGVPDEHRAAAEDARDADGAAQEPGDGDGPEAGDADGRGGDVRGAQERDAHAGNR